MYKINTIGVEKIQALFDAGTFVETAAYVRRKTADNDYEGVICGYGSIEGKLVFAFVQDGDRLKGAFDELHAKKIENLYAMAIANGAPVIGVFDSAGAVIYDGAAVLSGYGRVMKCVSDASGVIPQIALIAGTCSGSAAACAAMFDLTVSVEGQSKFYVNAPFLVGDEVKSTAYAAAGGLSAITAADETSAYASIRALIALLPQNNAEGTIAEICRDDLNRTVALAGLGMREIINTVSDNANFLSLYDGFGKEAIVGFSTIGGVVSGVIGVEGAITISVARKLSKFVSLCDSFHIPLVTLVDSEGLEVSKEAEDASFAAELARLAMAYSASTNAKITLIVGKAIGAAYTLLGSKSIGADLVLALPDACVSVLTPEASVAFVWNDKITADKSREDLETEWREKCATPVLAAELGEVDDIIEPAEARQRICAALLMLGAKIEGTPSRKHVNLPL